MKLGHPIPTPNELVSELVELARDVTAEGLSPEDQAGLYRLESTLLRAASPRRQRWKWFLLAPAAAAAAAAVAYGVREKAITFEVVSGRVSDGGYISSVAPDAAVRFSDHSDMGLDPGTSLRISHLEVRGAHVMLERGALHASIRTRPHGHWTLDAGPYVVHVTGTEFDLAWKVDEQTLDLRLREGSVTVEGPLADGGLRVTAGQHLVANANAGTLALDEFAAVASPPAVAAGLVAASNRAAVPSVALNALPSVPASALTTSALTAPPPAHTPAHPHADAHTDPGATWGARVARGDFEGVLEDAERRGIDRALADGSPADITALADAARYARRADVAMRALTTERKRFPSSVQARDASFFLAGLAEAQTSDAASLEWYETYLRESPNGAYAPQALGHRMMLAQRLGGNAIARPIAVEYLTRFPSGPYAPQARKLTEVQ